jgi:hypothetical protein
MKLSFRGILIVSLSFLSSFAARPALAAGVAPSFYGDAPDEHHPWAIHDGNRPQPQIITPGAFSSPERPGKPPSDAVVLFDGSDLSKWVADDGTPTKWIVHDGAMECVPKSGYIRTKESFGDCQLHVEWAAPTKAEGESQGRGNSGVFLMGLVEVQVLDNYNNPTYPDGAAASIYGVNPPMANALRPPGQFQVYDIVFRRPIYQGGQVVDPGYVTVFQNGVLVQDHTRIEGETGHMRRSQPGPFPDKGPLKLQDHGNPVRYRNIWYRPLSPRASEGGTDGYLTTEATIAKRKEIAAMIREDALKQSNSENSMPQLLRLAESLVYEKDDATAQKVEQMSGQYVSQLKKLSGLELAAKKDEAKHLREALKFLARFKDIPDDFGPKVDLDQIAKEQNWDKK